MRSSRALVVVLFTLMPATGRAAEWFVAAGASGVGSAAAPFGRIQAAINAATPGDVVIVSPGTYEESLTTARDGASHARITVRALGPRGGVLVTAPGRVLTVAHEHQTFEGLVFDGQYGPDDVIKVRDGGSHLALRDCEVRRTSRDAIDMAAPADVLIERCLIHHALNAADGGRDAHGIVAGAARRLTIRDTEIHTFSGDGFQIDPARAAAGWGDITVERCEFWLAPLPEPENGFPAGAVPGENAVDTKASNQSPRARLTIRDSIARGFRGGRITNMAAFNLKENVDVVVDGVTVRDAEIAFRVRGPGSARAGGAWVRIQNAVIFDVATAFRYEDDIEHLGILNSTLGRSVGRAFDAASARRTVPDARNLLILAGPLPREARHRSNLVVDPEAFVDAESDDYRLADGSRATDAGDEIPEVTLDRQGTPRPQHGGWDVGAFERAEAASPEAWRRGRAVKPRRRGAR